MDKEEITQLINDAAQELGYMIYESSVFLKGENSRIIVKIDSLTGITHQDCEAYGSKVTELVDEADILPNYSLEISSPGLDRKLRTFEEFSRFEGELVKVVFDKDENREVIKGSITGVAGDAVKIKSENEEIEISLSNIVNANLDY